MSRHRGIVRRLAAALFLLSLLFPLAGHAHQASDGYLDLRWQGGTWQGRLDIALRDLEVAVGLDADADGAITWGELRGRHAEIAAYALDRLELDAGGRPCDLRPAGQQVDHHGDVTYSVLRFRAECAGGHGALRVGYRLFFDLDPTHRGILRLESPAGVSAAVLSPAEPRFTLEPGNPGVWPEFARFWREGVWHIWIGYDHILFLLTLLLPAVLRREGGRWRAVDGFKPALLDTAGVVTAFTAAHSVTLALATLGLVVLPSRWVESVIAASVVVAAVNNLRPILAGRRWLIAFGLGLVHGFGFAGVLGELDLPGSALGLALAGFNLGVEVGQLALVAFFLPVAFLLRESVFYRRAILGVGSVAVAAVAAAWLLERSLGLLPS